MEIITIEKSAIQRELSDLNAAHLDHIVAAYDYSGKVIDVEMYDQNEEPIFNYECLIEDLLTLAFRDHKTIYIPGAFPIKRYS
jgi:hypothetical protein